MTLVEVMVGGVLTVLALGAVMFFVEASFRQTRAVSDQVGTLDDTTRAFERIIREIRTAAVVTPQGGARLTLRRWVGEDAATAHTITYDCTQPGTSPGTKRCTRTDATAGTGTQLVVDNVLNETVFTARAAQPPAINPPVEVELRLRVPDRPNPVVLSGLATSRNCATGGGELGTCEE